MSDIFEEILKEMEDENEELLEENTVQEWGVDFKTGQLTGRIVEGAEAIKVWAWNALKTQRYRYPIYSWYYGSDLEELIGNQYSEEYIKAEVQRMLEECLLENPNIEEVTDISCEFKETVLTIHCRLITAFGEEELDVRGFDI